MIKYESRVNKHNILIHGNLSLYNLFILDATTKSKI